VHVHRQLAADDRVAGVLDGIGCQPRQLDAARDAADVQRQRRDQRVGLACDLDRRVAVDAAADRDFGQFGSLGRKPANRAGEVGQVGGVVGPDEVVGEVDVTSLDLDAAEADRRPRRGFGS